MSRQHALRLRRARRLRSERSARTNPCARSSTPMTSGSCCLCASSSSKASSRRRSAANVVSDHPRSLEIIEQHHLGAPHAPSAAPGAPRWQTTQTRQLQQSTVIRQPWPTQSNPRRTATRREAWAALRAENLLTYLRGAAAKDFHAPLSKPILVSFKLVFPIFPIFSESG